MSRLFDAGGIWCDRNRPVLIEGKPQFEDGHQLFEECDPEDLCADVEAEADDLARKAAKIAIEEGESFMGGINGGHHFISDKTARRILDELGGDESAHSDSQRLDWLQSIHSESWTFPVIGKGKWWMYHDDGMEMSAPTMRGVIDGAIDWEGDES